MTGTLIAKKQHTYPSIEYLKKRTMANRARRHGEKATCRPLPFAITVHHYTTSAGSAILAIVYIELITRSHQGVELSSAISLRSVKSSWTGNRRQMKKERG